MKQYKPETYNSVSPYFVVENAPKLAELIKTIFNANFLRRSNNADGSIMHMEIQIDDSVIMLGDASDKFPPIKQIIHVYVPDVTETFKKAMDAGCVTIEEPNQREGDPDKRGTFSDFAGNMWSIGTQL